MQDLDELDKVVLEQFVSKLKLPLTNLEISIIVLCSIAIFLYKSILIVVFSTGFLYLLSLVIPIQSIIFLIFLSLYTIHILCILWCFRTILVGPLVLLYITEVILVSNLSLILFYDQETIWSTFTIWSYVF